MFFHAFDDGIRLCKIIKLINLNFIKTRQSDFSVIRLLCFACYNTEIEFLKNVVYNLYITAKINANACVLSYCNFLHPSNCKIKSDPNTTDGVVHPTAFKSLFAKTLSALTNAVSAVSLYADET